MGAAVGLTLLAGVISLRLLHPPERISFAKFRAIARGMTETEVEGILGGPATRDGDGNFWGSGQPASGRYRVWSGGGNEIQVVFGQDGRVKLAAFRSDHPTNYEPSPLDSLLDSLRKRLGL
jgi:hypothetical protein